MSLSEILFYRIPQFIQKNISGHFQLNKKFGNIKLNPKFISNTQIHKLANKPFDKKYRFFDTKVDISNEINFLTDYKNNITSQQKYYSKINRQNFNTIGDVKYVCEISRMHFLPYLALEGNLNLIKKHLINFSNQNPFLKTIHWTSGIEVAIRSINFIYAHQILLQNKQLSKALDDLIKDEIKKSYFYLKKHLSLYSSANNHLFAEVSALVMISSYFTNKQYKKEHNKWVNLFYQEVNNQTLNDGVNMELSSRYHIEVTDYFLQTVLFIQKIGEQVPVKIIEKLKKSLSYIQHLTFSGVNSNFGDSDDGYLVNPYFQNDFNYFESLLQSSDLMFSTSYSVNKKIDYRNILLFNTKLGYQVTKPVNSIYKNSGYGFLYDDKLKLSFDFGKIGDDISSAHGHSDLLSFTLQIGNQPIIVDTGTYQYHKKDIFWRNYFRSIQAHNTISIENLQHGKMNNRMSWTEKSTAKLLDYNIKTNNPFIKASTNSFNKINVSYNRTISLNSTKKRIKINDILVNSNSSVQKGVFYLHFHPNIEVSKVDEEIELKYNSSIIIINNILFKNAELIKGDVKTPFGWFSDKYDFKQKTTSLKVSITVEKELSLQTIIDYEKV